MNYLFCSAGRRVQLIRFFRESLNEGDRIVATDNQKYAPALQAADKRYLVPKITDERYIDILLDICAKESINALFTMIDPEIELLARNRERFEEIGVNLFVPDEKTAQLCFDKFRFYKYLVEKGIPTVLTLDTYEEYVSAKNAGTISLPVFVKPRTGSGSVGARRVDTEIELKEAMIQDPTLIIQEFMQCEDIDVDIYVDAISHKAVSAFSKKKIETRIGGASKTISFVDDALFHFVENAVQAFTFYGTIDMDLFYRDGHYYLSEVNPRFGGAYLHGYGAGVNFIKMIQRNLQGLENTPVFGLYPENHVMMMFDSVVFSDNNKLFDVEVK